MCLGRSPENDWSVEWNPLWNFSRVHHEEKLCDFFFNLGQWFRRCRLKDFLSGALVVLLFGAAEPFMQFWKMASCWIFFWSYMEFGPVVQKMWIKDISCLKLWPPLCSADPNHLCNFSRRYHEEQFFEIVLNLGQWYRRRCRLKDFLSEALATLLFSGAEPFMQFWKRASWGTFMCSYMKLGPVVQDEMSFKEKVNGRTTDEDRSQAQVS